MTEQAMSGTIDPNSVRKVVRVEAPQAVAWRVFTEEMGTLVAASDAQDREGPGGERGDRAARRWSLV